jgi:hypothetical protein
MPIRVICPGCHTRFQVGDQHAGKSGACPKCKGPIQIPASNEEVVIHSPEMEAGAVDSKGRSVLKPIKRKETKFQPNLALMIGGAALLCVVIAFLIGQNRGDLGESLWWILAAGACLLGPPLAYSGYSFLRDDELGAYEGTNLALRCLVCGLVYALLWGVYMWLAYNFFGLEQGSDTQLEMVHVAMLIVPLAGIGTFAAFVSFDLEPLTGFFHFALYFCTTILLRWIMQLPLLPGMGGGS